MDCDVIDLGLVDYITAYNFQKHLLKNIKQGISLSTIVLCEHFPVVTLGRQARKENLLVNQDYLFQNKIGFYCIDRGGDITFHGPGQLMVYPLIDLKKSAKDLHLFLRKIENSVIRFLEYFNINSRIINGLRGVWVKDEKIASIGIGVSGWVTFHGTAININTDLEYFSLIKPCGLDIIMTSVSDVVGNRVCMLESKAKFLESFKEEFGLAFSNLNKEGLSVKSIS